MLLAEEDLLVRPLLRTPLLDATLKRPDLARVVLPGMLLHQPPKQGLPLQRRCLLKHLLHLWPVLLEGVLPGLPVPEFSRDLGRHFAQIAVLPSGSPVESGLHRGLPDFSVFSHFFHEFPHLSVCYRQLSTSVFKYTEYRRVTDPQTPGQWGILVVADGEK